MIPPNTTPRAVCSIFVFSRDSIIYRINATMAIGVSNVNKVDSNGIFIPKYDIAIFNIISITSTITIFSAKNSSVFINIEFPILHDV